MLRRGQVSTLCSIIALTAGLVGAAPSVALAQTPAPQAGTAGPRSALPSPSDELLRTLREIYKDIHANPELPMMETRTAGIAARWLRENGYEVTEGVGKTGVVGLLRNGDGPTVMLRADMDALPIPELTGAPYASNKIVKDADGKETPVSHMCGHDLHVTWLMGAAKVLADNRGGWRGTVMAVFQPAEESGEGARAMVEDGMTRRFPKPAVVLGQHVLPQPAGTLSLRAGPMLSRSDTLEIKFYGRGGHGSSPETTVDPVAMAAYAVTRLQTVISREVGMTERAVVSVGSISAGTSPNSIPNDSTIGLNIRTFDEDVRERVMSAIERIVNAEAAASGSPRKPEIRRSGMLPLTSNHEGATRRVTEAFLDRFGKEQVGRAGTASASEDFSWFARAWEVPQVYWIVGGTDPREYAEAEKNGTMHQLPSNHSSHFLPVLDPTLRVGVEAMLAAASPWIVRGSGVN